MSVDDIHCNYCLSLISEARDILDTDKIQRLTQIVRDVIEGGNVGGDTGSTMAHLFGRQPWINVFMCGASLAHHGLLGPVIGLSLADVDLSSVPAQHLVSLVSSVTSCIRIQNVSGCDLASLLSSVKCGQLHITRQSLGREETQALVQAKDSRVKKVKLHKEVTLDIEALAQYSNLI